MPAATVVAGTPARAALPVTDLADGLDLSGLPGRDLDQCELIELASSIAARPDRWVDEVAFDDEHRHFACLHRDEHVDVWLLCWTAANDTGWHDHDVSSGAVAVVRGLLLEHSLCIGAPNVAASVAGGRAFSFGPEHIHRLTGSADSVGGAVSVHAYSPPLRRLGQYDVSPSGVLRRTTVPYTDELRPSGADSAEQS